MNFKSFVFLFNSEKLKALKASMAASGGTNLTRAIEASMKMMHDRAEKSPDLPRYVILVTDVSKEHSKPLERQPEDGMR